MKERRDVLKKYQTEIEDRLSKVRREKDEIQQDILKQADAIVKAVRAAVWQVRFLKFVYLFVPKIETSRTFD